MSDTVDYLSAVMEIKSILKSPDCRYTYFFNSNSVDTLITLFNDLIGEANTLSISDYCDSADSIPDLVKLCNDLEKRSGPTILRGLDRYLQYQSVEEKDRIYHIIMDITSNNGALVVLSYKSETILRSIVDSDRRKNDKIYYIEDSLADCSHKTYIISDKISEDSSFINGLKDYLRKIEQSDVKSICYLRTKLYDHFKNAQIPICKVDSYKQLIELRFPEFSYLSDSNENIWKRYYQEKKFNLNVVFKDQFGSQSFSEILSIISNDYGYWLFASYIRSNPNNQKYPYLTKVAEISEDVEDFRYNLLYGLLLYDNKSVEFNRIYRERKSYLSSRVTKNIHDYCVKVLSTKDPLIAIDYLTDCTHIEKEAVLDCIIACNSISPDVLNSLNISYPDLFKYFSKTEVYPEPIRPYFKEYRELKVLNSAPDATFMEMVKENVTSPKYFKFEHRDMIFKNIITEHCKVLFIDALGVEYMPYILSLCEEMELDVVEDYVCRVNLPTITSQNTSVLKDYQYISTKKLDEFAHNCNNYDNDYCASSKIVIDQLDIIRKIIQSVRDEIKGSEQIILYSDHGLSRLYVLHGQTEEHLWNVDADHNGRCAKVGSVSYEDWSVKQESEYYVVADYSRIRNNIQKAKIEAHGGATLEEVLVPILKISNSGKKYKECEMPDSAILDPISGATMVSVFYPTDTEELTLNINSNTFIPTKSNNNYVFKINNISIGVFNYTLLDGRHKLKEGTLKITGKGLKKNSMFSKFR